MKELTTLASLENIAAVTAFVDEFLEAVACPMKIQMKIDIVIDEIFSNIVKFAYPESEGHVTVRVNHNSDNKEFSLSFIDQGIPYDPFSHEDPDITLSAEDREIGGLGIFMVKNMMDSVDYEYVDNNNITTIKTIL